MAEVNKQEKKQKNLKKRTETTFFDIKKLYSVLDANKWTEGKNFMKFWEEGSPKVAKLDAVGKSTLRTNINVGLRIYKMKWSWVLKFPYVKGKYNLFFKQKVHNGSAVHIIKKTYSGLVNNQISHATFNDWLLDGLSPQKYLKHHKKHQIQRLAVNSYDLNDGKFDDMVAALNGFNFYAFYKGGVINLNSYRGSNKKVSKNKGKTEAKTSLFTKIPKNIYPRVEKHLQDSRIKKLIYITHLVCMQQICMNLMEISI